MHDWRGRKQVDGQVGIGDVQDARGVGESAERDCLPHGHEWTSEGSKGQTAGLGDGG